MLARVVTSLAMSLPVAAPIAGYFTWKLSSKVAASKRASPPSPGGKSLSGRKGSSSSLRSRGVDVGTAAAGPESATTGTDAFAPTTASRGSQIKAAAVDAGSSTPRRIAAAAGSQTAAGIDAPSPRVPFSGHIPGFAARIAQCNEITEADMAKYVPLIVAGKHVGAMQRSFADELVRHGDGVFTDVTDGSANDGDASSSVVMDPQGKQTVDERSAAAAVVMDKLRSAGVITGWRDELFPVNEGYGEPPVMLVERAAASLLGIRAYGVHINGYTTAPDGTQQLWVAKRSKLKPTFPGKLDHLVAGGLPAGIPPMECVIKECGEEASIPPELARMSRPVGIITYNANYQGCCKRDVLFCYDLELPVDFEPVPDDGEVECFERYDVDRLMRCISETEEFKTNCAVVIIDWLVRHGYLSPEEPGYAPLVKSIRQ